MRKPQFYVSGKRPMCLQTVNCAAYSYNTSDSTCVRFITPCPLAKNDPVMELGILRARTHLECCEWIPFTCGEPQDDRNVVGGKTGRTVARTTEGEVNYFGYYHTAPDACYIVTSATRVERINGSPCERLRITEGCTVLWAPYTVGDPIPANSIIGGENTDGDDVYIVSFNEKAGYYPRGAAHGAVPHGEIEVHPSTQMELLILI